MCRLVDLANKIVNNKVIHLEYIIIFRNKAIYVLGGEFVIIR